MTTELLSTTDITHVIQLAVAPVFLLTAVATIINVLSTRIARIVDRMRALEERLFRMTPEERPSTQAELALNTRRLRLVYIAVTLQVLCAMFVGLFIVIAFSATFLSINLSQLIAGLFIAAMLSFIGALGVFLYEIFLAVTSARRKATADTVCTR